MALAEIHGKTPFIYSEDLLTANVFTVFRYLPTADGLYAFLQSIPGLGDQLPDRANDLVTVTYHFWPSGVLNRREPDLLLALQIGQRLIHIVVEAKFLSGASDLEIQEIEQGQQVVQAGNQLADQLRDLRHGEYKTFQDGQRNDWLTLTSVPTDRFLLYLTAHIRQPKTEIKQAQIYYPKAADKLFWANWYQVYAHFRALKAQLTQPPYPLILQDICLLLARKGFAVFQGFHLPIAIQVDLSEAAFWAERHRDTSAFAGITLPPDTSMTGYLNNIFWMGDKNG